MYSKALLFKLDCSVQKFESDFKTVTTAGLNHTMIEQKQAHKIVNIMKWLNINA